MFRRVGVGVAILLISLSLARLLDAVSVAELRSQLVSGITRRAMDEFASYGNVIVSVDVAVPDQWRSRIETLPTVDIRLPEAGKVGGRIVVPVRIPAVNGRPADTAKLLVTTTVVADYIVAAKDLSQGHIMTSQDVVIRRGDISTFTSHGVGVVDLVLNRELKIPLGNGNLVTTLMIRDVPDIHRGDTVWVDYRNSGILLKVPGESLSDGQRGDKVRVRLKLDSHKVLEGKIVDSSTVRIIAAH